MTRVGIYLRISDDQDGTSTATDRQREDCERFAQYKGWDVVEVFEDRDLSAFKQNVVRPQFERMVKAVEQKEIDGVIAWRFDRIARRLRDFVRLDELCETTGGFIASAADGVATNESSGRLIASLLVSMARAESEGISTRLKRKNVEMVRQGRPQTGGTRPFGYDSKRAEIVPEEASLIREARDRVFAGESLRGICWDWQYRGVKTPTGIFWKQVTLKRMLLSAALSAQREHGTKSNPSQAVLTPGNWPAIISPEDTARLRLILRDPGRTKRTHAVRYLLTGFLRCGACGERLVARPRGDHTRRYVCARQPDYPNCGKLARLAEPIEEVVKLAIFAALQGVDFKKKLSTPSDEGAGLDELIAADEDRLKVLAVEFADGNLSRAEWQAGRDRINGRLELNRSKRERLRGNAVIEMVISAADAIDGQWDERDIEWRRSVIGALIDHVVIHPAVKGDNRFNPKLVEIHWKY